MKCLGHGSFYGESTDQRVGSCRACGGSGSRPKAPDGVLVTGVLRTVATVGLLKVDINCNGGSVEVNIHWVYQRADYWGHAFDPDLTTAILLAAWRAVEAYHQEARA